MARARRFSMGWLALVLAFALAAASGAYAQETEGEGQSGSGSGGGVYPTNKCVSAKVKASAKKCKSVLGAWSKWDRKQDDAERDALLTKAADKFSGAWAKAETKSSQKDVDCAQTTLTEPNMEALIDTGIAGIVAAINAGLDLGDKDQAKCGSKLLKIAAGKCGQFLKAESLFLKKLSKDPDGSKRDAKQADASAKFSAKWDKASAGCLTSATEAGIEGLVDDLVAAVVFESTVSPNVDPNQFIVISPTGTTEYQGKALTPICMDGTDPYHFFAKRGTVNKLLMYYQGGGACWENLTCSVPVCKTSVSPVGDDPTNASTGFADLSNPANPFRDWNVVFVPYCSCDVHFGDAEQTYSGIFPDIDVKHRGYHNAKIAEKWAREHFVNPETIFVTGSSAGAYGAWFHAGLLHDVWPASDFHVLADAGNGVITTDFLQNYFSNWDFEKNLPPGIPGVAESITEGTGIVGFTEAVGEFFPNTNWAHYSSAFDGGTGGQTGFYNLMLNDNDPIEALTWWEGSCAFNSVMRQQAIDISASLPDNYRYYIGTGSRHTTWGADKVYTDTTGGVPLLVDWIEAMLASDPNWVNVEASPFNVLLPGDVQPPSLPTAPFELSDPNDPGSDVIVNCP